ncbi:MAG: NAD-dependent epimerase/dehydratase family protein [Gemmataceae bacterium]
MHCVVTGAAGFIGSHLCEELLRQGHSVAALDAFVPYYAPKLKQRNRDAFAGHARCRFHTLDLRTDPLEPAVADADVIFHLAAMPGLAKSWSDFDGYFGCNVLGTQRLIDAVQRSAPKLRRLIYASTSSVYGRFASGDESLPPKPISPYGVTKLAAEHLCRAHGESNGLPAVTLRYFSVYGPRQRPDMGYYKFIRALLHGELVEVFGHGRQVRGNTYVSDCVAATLAAVEAAPGEVYNVGGGETASVWDILHRLESITGAKARVRQSEPRKGDQRHTLADTTKLRRHLGWEPRVGLDEGLARQVEWQRQQADG